MIPIKRKSFINRYRILSDVFVFSLVATIQSKRVKFCITITNIPIQRWIIPRQPYRVLGDIFPFIGWVVAETVVIQILFHCPRTALGIGTDNYSKNAYCKITFFSLEKVIFLWLYHKITRLCSAKGGRNNLTHLNRGGLSYFSNISGEDIILSIIFSCSTFSFDVSISYSFSYNFCEIV